MDLCRKGLHLMVGPNVVMNGRRRRCRACWYEARRNIRRLDKALEGKPPTIGSSLTEMAKALDEARARATALQALLDRAIKTKDHARLRFEKEERKVGRLQKELQAVAKLVEGIECLYAQKASETNAF